MLEKKGVGFSSDIYGIGCVLYEMLVGEPPYFDESLDKLLDNIKSGRLRYASYLTIEAKSLISKLLERDINKRLGVKDINEIKNHDFFKKLDWKLLENKQLKPPKELLER
jgi:serine/threonine protein kinase